MPQVVVHINGSGRSECILINNMVGSQLQGSPVPTDRFLKQWDSNCNCKLVYCSEGVPLN